MLRNRKRRCCEPILDDRLTSASRLERDCTHHVMFGELGQWAGIDYQRARTCGRKDSGRVLESDIWRHSVDVNYVEISNQNVRKFHT